MTTVLDTHLLMNDFLQRNEKLRSLIGESLPSKEKKSKLSNELMMTNEEVSPLNFLLDSQRQNPAQLQTSKIQTKTMNQLQIGDIDFNKIEKLLESTSIDKRKTDQYPNEKSQECVKSLYQQVSNQSPSHLILTLNGESSQTSSQGQDQVSSQLEEDLITTQEMSRILNQNFQNSTIVQYKDSLQRKQTPKSPLFKKNPAMKKQGSNTEKNQFIFDLKAVKECNNQLEESLSYLYSGRSSQHQQHNDEDSLFLNARKKLNLETALLEKSSVVSDNIEIKSQNNSDEDGSQSNAYKTPCTNNGILDQQNQQNKIITDIVMQHQVKLLNNLRDKNVDQEALTQITNQFDCMIKDLSSNLTLGVKPSILRMNEQQVFPQLLCDIKSESSSKYLNSVAAFSAQPMTHICGNCKRRISANNFVLPQKGLLSVNPFIRTATQPIKRVMSGGDFNPFQLQAKAHCLQQQQKRQSDQVRDNKFDNLKYKCDLTLKRQRSVSYDSDQRRSRVQSMIEEEGITVDQRDSHSPKNHKSNQKDLLCNRQLNENTQ